MGEPRTFLVTGGTGFLGRAIVDRLIARGDRVRVLARSPDASLPEPAEFVAGSVLDEAVVDGATAGVDGVFHIAGQVLFSRKEGYERPRALHVDGTLHVVRAAAAAGARVVYASTSGVSACSLDPDAMADDETPYATERVRHWPYYQTKLEAERAALEEAAKLGAELVVLRPSLLLGPGDTRFSSTAFLVDYLRERIPVCPSGGVSTIDVRDAADSFVAALDRGRPGVSYLVGGENVLFAELIERLERITGIRGPHRRLPYALAWTSSALACGALRLFGSAAADRFDPVVTEMTRCYWFFDARRARDELGLAPRPLDDTLRDAIAWIRPRLAEAR